jgi:hypothetical protein
MTAQDIGALGVPRIQLSDAPLAGKKICHAAEALKPLTEDVATVDSQPSGPQKEIATVIEKFIAGA